MTHPLAVAVLFSLLPLTQQVTPKPPEKALTAFPLRELSPEKAAKELERYAEFGVVLTPIPREKTLLVYADVRTTKSIERSLEQLGEPRAISAVWQLKGDVDSAVAFVKKCYPADKVPTLVPLPAEKRLLVHADSPQVREVFTLLWPAEMVTAPEPTFTVEFRDVPWSDVIEWYSKISGLKFISAIMPQAKCTLTPGKDKKFTLAGVTDLLIEALTPHKMSVIRRDTSWFIWPTDEKIDPYVFPRIMIDELPKWGNLELVSLLIPLPASLPVERYTDEVNKALGKQSRVHGVEKWNAFMMLDTGGNVRRALDVLAPLLRQGPKKP
jgi:hypothetical protein